MNGQDDEQLVRAFKSGDEKAFDQIYGKYYMPVYSICYRYTRNEADARDLTQEVFIKVYRNLGKFNMRSKFFTWMYRIAVNTCISFKRRERRFAHPAEFEVQVVPIGERVGMKVAIDNALMKLPERQRMTFILRHYEGYTYDEISCIMGITTGAAKANHHQAVKKLRIFLRDWL